ncbi:hypothetical protein [Priestia aryabhattai]|uniref:hypothetical protein n=1 Tax=Priestia aryabhattai TaxID=412384 RepID=UPI003D279720
MNVNELVSQLLEKAESVLPPGELVPYIGNLFQFNKNRQFEKRIKANEEKLIKIFKSISEVEYDFFVEKIGTLAIQKIILDEQDDKAEYFVLGFENCVNKNLKDEDRIINYFDVISDLRMIDIKRLIFLYEYLEGKEPENVFGSDISSHTRYVDQKLDRMNLIIKPTFEGMESDTVIDQVTITTFALEILDFIGYVYEQ